MPNSRSIVSAKGTSKINQVPRPGFREFYDRKRLLSTGVISDGFQTFAFLMTRSTNRWTSFFFICTTVLRGRRLKIFVRNELTEVEKPNKFQCPKLPQEIFMIKVLSMVFDAVFSV